ncbi:MAG: hypothetical protein IT373_29795, partial [Polyangiaceae bacterium]|nr:hypothetical protein [Polyangiaceae bacterium]
MSFRRTPKLAPPTLLAACLASLSGAAVARAEGVVLHAPLAPESVRIDGLLREWDTPLAELKYALKGEASSGDIGARALVSYDRESLYVAAEVRDDKVVANADHVELVLGIPGGTTKSVLLYPGVPGKTAAEARLGKGGRVAGSEIVEAPLEGGGYSLEAKIPWTTFPEAKTVRIGLRGAVLVNDADAGNAIETTLGTASSRSYADLPAISTEPELALGMGLLRQERIWDAPSYNLMADVAGDAMSERVMVYGRFLVVMGPTYRGGAEYFFRDMGSDARRGEVGKIDVRDVTADGKADILILRKDGGGSRLEVLSFGSGEVPDELLSDGLAAHATTVSVSGGKGAARITHSGDGRSRAFELKGGKFELVEDKGGGAPGPGPGPSIPKPPPVPTPRPAPPAAADLEAVYALYKKERSVSGPARFDVSANLAGDGKAERVVLHDRNLVTFGPGFRKDHAYTTVTLNAFAHTKNIH